VFEANGDGPKHQPRKGQIVTIGRERRGRGGYATIITVAITRVEKKKGTTTRSAWPEKTDRKKKTGN